MSLPGVNGSGPGFFDASMIQSILNQSANVNSNGSNTNNNSNNNNNNNNNGNNNSGNTDGNNFMENSDFGGVKTTKIDIPPMQEWRFELETKDTLKLKITNGVAEIFGTELSSSITYSFTGPFKLCISTFKGCSLEYHGCQLSSEYISDDSCLSQYLSLHLSLEKMRTMENDSPRVLIVGPSDSGKTSVSKVLSSYAEKMDHQPLLINLNPRDPQFVIPGSLTSTCISDMLNVENMNYGETITTGVSFYHQKQPIAKCYGLENFNDNIKLYKYLIQQLGSVVNKRLSNDINIKKSGFIIDTPSFSAKDSDVIQEIIGAFDINIVLVMGNERLMVDLKKHLHSTDPTTKPLHILKINKSSGCVDKDDKFIRELQQRSIREYFYGIPKMILSPYSLTVNFSDVIILKPIETNNDSSLSFYGGGDDEDDENNTNPSPYTNDGKLDYKRLIERVKQPNSSILNNAILSMYNPGPNSLLNEPGKFINGYEQDEQLLTSALSSSSMGFVYVSNCDDTKSKLRLLLPIPTQTLPCKILFLTKFRYHE